METEIIDWVEGWDSSEERVYEHEETIIGDDSRWLVWNILHSKVIVEDGKLNLTNTSVVSMVTDPFDMDRSDKDPNLLLGRDTLFKGTCRYGELYPRIFRIGGEVIILPYCHELIVEVFVGRPTGGLRGTGDYNIRYRLRSESRDLDCRMFYPKPIDHDITCGWERNLFNDLANKYGDEFVNKYEEDLKENAMGIPMIINGIMIRNTGSGFKTVSNVFDSLELANVVEAQDVWAERWDYTEDIESGLDELGRPNLRKIEGDSGEWHTDYSIAWRGGQRPAEFWVKDHVLTFHHRHEPGYSWGEADYRFPREFSPDVHLPLYFNKTISRNTIFSGECGFDHKYFINPFPCPPHSECNDGQWDYSLETSIEVSLIKNLIEIPKYTVKYILRNETRERKLPIESDYDIDCPWERNLFDDFSAKYPGFSDLCENKCKLADLKIFDLVSISGDEGTWIESWSSLDNLRISHEESPPPPPPPVDHCFNGVQDEDEEDVDCGGSDCPRCPGCKKLIYNGPDTEKIDIVFIPDKDYHGDLDKFKADVQKLAGDYLSFHPFDRDPCKFNFWYIEEEGDYEETCNFTVPDKYYTECGFSEVGVIIHQDIERDCAGGVISSEFNDYHVLVHESGHGIFDLGDEYCCDSSYSISANIFPDNRTCNLFSLRPAKCWEFCPAVRCDWPSEAACRSFASANGLNPTQCNGTCSPNWCLWRGVGWRPCCDGGWWKSDPGNDIMEDSAGGILFGPDCLNQVNRTLDNYKNCTAKGKTASEEGKSILLEMHTSEGKLTVLNKTVINLESPQIPVREEKYNISLLSPDDNIIDHFLFRDPTLFRIIDWIPGEPTMMYRDNINFTILIPFIEDLKSIEIRDNRTNELIETIDLSRDIYDYCVVQANFNEPECRFIDLDNDSIFDYEDNCPFLYNPMQEDLDWDWIGDDCDNQTCGNGILENPEKCDDGNFIDGDGCSSECKLEDIPGDVNSDCKVNIFDLAAVGKCFGCLEAFVCWEDCSSADVKMDSRIDIFDLATVGKNYGNEC